MKNTGDNFYLLNTTMNMQMPGLKLKQLQYETDTWKRLLGFIEDENILLKTRLSEVLRNSFANSMLEDAELFQTGFIKKDEAISQLRNEIAVIDKLLVREIQENGKLVTPLHNRIKKLRSKIAATERQFGRLKTEFNSFLLENIQEVELQASL